MAEEAEPTLLKAQLDWRNLAADVSIRPLAVAVTYRRLAVTGLEFARVLYFTGFGLSKLNESTIGSYCLNG